MSSKLLGHFFLRIAGLFLFCTISFYALFLAYGYQYDVKNLDVRKTSIIDLNSKVSDVDVFLNEKSVYRGNLPYQIKDVVPGTFKLLIQKSGFLPWKKVLQVKADFVSKITDILLVPEDVSQFIERIHEKISTRVENTRLGQNENQSENTITPQRQYSNNDGIYYMRDGMLFYSEGIDKKTMLLDQSSVNFSSLRVLASKNYTFIILLKSDKTEIMYFAKRGKILGIVSENITGQGFVNDLDEIIFADAQNQLFIFDAAKDSKTFLKAFEDNFNLAGWFDDAHFLYRINGKLYMSDVSFFNVYALF